MPNTREQLIELIEKAKHNWSLSTMVPFGCTFESWIADHLIANGVTVQKWIPVTERLPEDGKEVLIYCGSYHEMGWYESKDKSWRSDFLGNCTDDVTHWMPLPEPPKGE